MSCPFCDWTPENREYRLIFKTEYWRVTLPPNQSLIGTCCIELQRHAGSLASLRDSEMLDFLGLVQYIESVLKQAFGTTMYNWMCLMNHTYRGTNPDPHVHWWVVPRYNHSVLVNDLTFDDPLFGYPFSHDRIREVPESVRDEIIRQILVARHGVQ